MKISTFLLIFLVFFAEAKPIIKMPELFDLHPQITYGRGFLIERKNVLLFTRKKDKSKMFNVGEIGKVVRKYVRL